MAERLSGYTLERLRHGSLLHDRVDVLTAKPEFRKDCTLPLLVLPGFLANTNPKIFEDVAKGFADLDRETHVVTFERFYRGSRLSNDAQKSEFTGEKPQKGDPSIMEFNKAVALLNYMDAQGIERADLAPHSSADQAALYAIALAPERFGNAVFVTPTTLNKEYPIDNLVPRFAKQITPEIVKNLKDKKSRRATRRHLVSGSVTTVGHPMRTLWYERRAIQRTDLSDIFSRCNTDPEYPNIVVLAGTQDSVFGPEQLKVEHTRYDGGHNDFIAGRLTGQIDQTLTQMAAA